MVQKYMNLFNNVGLRKARIILWQITINKAQKYLFPCLMWIMWQIVIEFTISRIMAYFFSGISLVNVGGPVRDTIEFTHYKVEHLPKRFCRST